MKDIWAGDDGHLRDMCTQSANLSREVQTSVLRPTNALWTRSGWFVILLLVLVIAALYGPGLRDYFVSDDFVNIEYSKLNSLQDILGFLTPIGRLWFYRPVIQILFGLDYSIFGLNPVPYHLQSLVLHCLNTGLVYLLALRLGEGKQLVGLTSAVVFASNWRHDESVWWISSMGDLLAAFFILLTNLLFLAYLSDKRKGIYVVSIGTFVLALLSKESAISLPLLLFLCGIFMLRSRGLVDRRFVRALLLYLGPFVLYLLFQYKTDRISRAAGVAGTDLFSNLLRFNTYSQWPIYFYGNLISLGRLILHNQLIGLAALGSLIGLFLFGYLRRHYLLSFGIAWSMLTSVVYLSFTSADSTILYAPNRYFYIPSIGFAIAVGFAALWSTRFLDNTKLWKSRLSLLVPVALGIIVGLSSVKLIREGHAWRQAGGTVETILDQVQTLYPELPGGCRLCFVGGLPDDIEGAYVFQNGIGNAIRLRYGDESLRARMVEDCPRDSDPSRLGEEHFLEYVDGHLTKIVCPR